jgi:hypothetical protein
MRSPQGKVTVTLIITLIVTIKTLLILIVQDWDLVRSTVLTTQRKVTLILIITLIVPITTPNNPNCSEPEDESTESDEEPVEYVAKKAKGKKVRAQKQCPCPHNCGQMFKTAVGAGVHTRYCKVNPDQSAVRRARKQMETNFLKTENNSMKKENKKRAPEKTRSGTLSKTSKGNKVPRLITLIKP